MSALHGAAMWPHFFRKLAWRLGRRLYCWARGDLRNDPLVNGEYWILDEVIRSANGDLVLFDVGANKGDWSIWALSTTRRRQRSVALTAFEPCSGTRRILRDRLAAFDGVRISGIALSSRSGTAEFFTKGDGAGTNSLSSVSGDRHETVEITTVDKFMESHGISELSMIKIDTEGFDFDVLLGSEIALAAGKIELVQFEYNWRWQINHRCLRDVFELIVGKPYRLAKLNGGSIEFYDSWHFELDRYFENNYLLVRNDSTCSRLGNTYRFDESNCPVPVADVEEPGWLQSNQKATRSIQSHDGQPGRLE